MKLFSLILSPCQQGSISRGGCWLLAVGVLCASGQGARAAIQYWDTSNATGLTAGPGIWDSGVTPNWATAQSPGTADPTTWTDGNDAYFRALGTNQVTVSGTVVVGSLQSTTLGCTTVITNGMVQLTSPISIYNNNGFLTIASDVTLNSSDVATHRNSISFAPNGATNGSLTVSGNIGEPAGGNQTVRVGNVQQLAGYFVNLGGVNTFTGGLQIYRGASLNITSPSALGLGAVLFGNNGDTGQNYWLSATLPADGTITNKLIVSGGTGQTIFISSSGAGAATFSGQLVYTGALGVSGLGGFAGDAVLTLGGTSMANNTFQTAISNATAYTTSLIKQDAGTWLLTGNNNYSGATTVSGGTLFTSTRHTGGGTFTINDGQTLGVVNFGGGQSAQMAALTLGNGSGPSALVLTNVSFTSVPLVNVSGTVTVNGTSTITISGAGGLSAGSTYPLVKYDSLGGAGFGGLALSLPAGVTGSLTNDTANSWVALKVTSISALTSPKITYNISGSALTLGWPGGQGWILQSNQVGIASSGNWIDVPGSGAASSANLTIGSGAGNVFFRLRSGP